MTGVEWTREFTLDLGFDERCDVCGHSISVGAMTRAAVRGTRLLYAHTVCACPKAKSGRP